MTDRARRVVLTVPVPRYARAPDTTHSSPLQGLTGPAPLYLDLSPAAGWVPGIPSPYPPSPHTPPGYTPAPPVRCQHPRTPGHVQYSRF